MYAQWMDEQENIYPWIVNSSMSEQENVMDWIKSIGVGAAQGAGTGAAAGPWGALIGGLIGGGLGALQQATQPQSAPQRPSPPPTTSRPAPQPVTSPSPPVVPSSTPQPVTPASPASGSRDGTGAVQQFTQLLPQLIQLIQAIQPIIASSQQSTGRAREGNDDEGKVESLASDPVSDLDEQIAGISEVEDDEHIELPEALESTEDAISVSPTDLHPPNMFTLPATSLTAPNPNLNFLEWADETESAVITRPAFQWVG